MNLLSPIRKKKIFKALAFYLAANMLAGYFIPIRLMALTSGPAQEEFTSFEPVTTTDMVDLYSGDFNYNIPLLSVPGPNGGYPINLSYHSGVGMEQEASWVGLGWTLNVGAVNRQLRGLPDDFDGDAIERKMKIRDDWNIMVDMDAAKQEQFGFPVNTSNPSSSSRNWQLYFNNYKGFGFRGSVEMPHYYGLGGADVTFDSQDGIGIEPRLGLNNGPIPKLADNYDLSLSINSRHGLQSISLGMGFKKTFYSDVSSRAGVGINSSLTFSMIKSVPAVTMPTVTDNFSYDVSIGPASKMPVFGSYGARGWEEIWDGSFSNTKIQGDGTQSIPGYGYLYDNASSSNTDQRDFQRDPIPYSKKVPALAPSSMTYDIYSISGQGTGGMFRDYDSYIPAIGNATVASPQYDGHLNLEVGINSPLSLYHVGAGGAVGAGTSQSGMWANTENGSADDVGFTAGLAPGGSTDPSYEYVYPKMYGEKSGFIENDDMLSKWYGDKAVRAGISRDNDPSWFNQQFVADDAFLRYNNDASPVVPSTSNNSNVDRPIRESNIEQVTVGQATQFCYTKNIGYTLSSGSLVDNAKSYSASYLKPNHVTEISVLQSDGMRYVYGLPAYNTTQVDANFSVPSPGSSFNVPTVAVPHSGSDIDPSGTYQRYLSQTTLPAFAHSWMLTEVVSADYVDMTGNGPSDDDLGYWVKFNYTKKSDDYNWRVPYADASYSYGDIDDLNDDKGSVSFGTKQMYYLESIETKTHIAVFTLSKREDAIMANDLIAGGKPSTINDDMRMYKVDRIDLFTKSEYFDNTTRHLRSNAIPLQTIHFEYSYRLCGNVPNNTNVAIDVDGNNPSTSGKPDVNANHGKLTLDKVYFTNETSTRGQLSPYVFDYGSTSSTSGSADNPLYNVQSMDRWGNYKDIGTYYNTPYPFMDFPYTEQGASAARVDAWLLRSITLPTGGKLNIEYESDDYQYVQEKPAMEMLDIVGTASDYDPGNPSANTLSMSRTASTVQKTSLETYDELVTDGGEYKIYFKLEQTTTSNSPSLIYDKYLNNGKLDTVYFSLLVNLKGKNNPHFDRVKGYATVRMNSGDYGVVKSNPSGSVYDVGYITLNGVPKNSWTSSSPFINPITRAGLEHLHYERPDIAQSPLPQTSNPADNIMNILGAVINSPAEFASMFAGYNWWAYLKGYSHEMQLNGRSVIRLMDPDHKKFGGGVRVKKLTLTGSWVNGSNTENFEYGQKYSYVMEDGTTSGVAYEPTIGADEDALRTPIEYTNSTLVVGSQHQFLETPLLQSYYPGATVGYRRVIVESDAPDKAKSEDSSNDLFHSAAPTTIYEFYSPKDFPVTCDQTEMTSDPSIIRPIIIPGVFSSFKKRIARSQGYSVVLNDMAGKIKSITMLPYHITTSTYIPPDQVISKQTFIYQTKNPYDASLTNELCNKVQCMFIGSGGDPVYQTGVIGESSDIFIDMNENLEKSKNVGIEGNLDLNLSLPLASLVPIRTMSKFEASLRTVVVNKAIYRTGILKQVITQDHQSIVTTDNLAYDIATGDPILTKVVNEFNDDVFQYHYPGHWYYPSLEGAYQNYNVTINGSLTPSSNGRINLESVLPGGKEAKDYFTVGDEVFITDNGNSTYTRQYTVINVGTSTSPAHTFIDCMDAAGNLISNSATVNQIRVVRSGHKNMQSVSVGSLAAKSLTGFVAYDPADISTTDKTSQQSYSFDKILDASSVEYSDFWPVNCLLDCGETSNLIGHTYNPYHKGGRGLWRPYKTYSYVTTRYQGDNIRTDGYFSDFTTFDWKTPSNNASTNWVAANEITIYSPHSFELENKDAIGNYSSALYEYNNTLATAVASNARHKEIASDGFEDYAFLTSCPDPLDDWGFGGATTLDTVSSQHHTGRYSLHLGSNDSVSIARTLIYQDCDAFYANKRSTVVDPTDPSTTYTGDTCDCLRQFSPIPGKKYVISAWVKQSSAVPITSYTVPELEVKVLDQSMSTISTTTFTATGNIIEGWQRIYGTFTVPSGTHQIIVTYKNNAGAYSIDAYFDDVRIQPFDSNMMTYVYDPFNLRLVAQLDANNYATFYYYDSEGRLAAIKQETSEGIKTIKEGRASTAE